jgi:hypothetical protein
MMMCNDERGLVVSASAGGRMGSGLYLVDKFENATKISEHKSQNDSYVVLEFSVPVTAVRSQMHPAWAGLPEFREYVVSEFPADMTLQQVYCHKCRFEGTPEQMIAFHACLNIKADDPNIKREIVYK